MKNLIVLSIAMAAVAVRLHAQTAAAYQSYINSLSPSYYFTLDNNLTDSVGGSVSFTANGTGSFSSDYWGNSTGARLSHSSNDGLSTSTDLVNGGGPNAGNASATGAA